MVCLACCSSSLSLSPAISAVNMVFFLSNVASFSSATCRALWSWRLFSCKTLFLSLTWASSLPCSSNCRLRAAALLSAPAATKFSAVRKELILVLAEVEATVELDTLPKKTFIFCSPLGHLRLLFSAWKVDTVRLNLEWSCLSESSAVSMPKKSRVGLLCDTHRPSFFRKNMKSTIMPFVTSAGGASSVSLEWSSKWCRNTPCLSRWRPIFLAAKEFAMLTDRNVSVSSPSQQTSAASFFTASVSVLILNPSRSFSVSAPTTLGRKDDISCHDFMHSQRRRSSCRRTLLVSSWHGMLSGLSLPVLHRTAFMRW